MTERSTTALPHILKEYQAEYSQAADSSQKSPREPLHAKKAESKNEPVQQTHANETKVTTRDEGSKKNKEKRQDSPTRLKSRESSTLSDYQYYQQQKKEENFQKWQEFKTVNRDNEYSRLRKKVALQHELIHAQDELYQQKVQEKEQKQAEAKEEERRKKHAKEAELVATCRQSLELDKEKIANRRAHIQALHQKKEEKEAGDENLLKETESRRPLSVIRSRGGDSTRTSVTSSGLIDYSREDTFASFISEVDSLDGQPDELPVHKSELYRLFGTKQANYFLYPRIEPVKKKKIRVNPALRRQGGRAGASSLWSILRGQSRIKLVQADQRIPSELKDAYGAFVRECLTQHKTVAKRSFYSETEVPESEKIQDSSYHERVREMKHKMELMFRAAQLNEDKTSILLFNNPPPDFNDQEGQEGLMRYHPSWVPEEDVISEEGYKRWLKTRPIDWPTMEGEVDTEQVDVVTPHDSRPSTRKSDASDAESDDSDDWLINMIVNKPEEEEKEEKAKTKPPPKLVFLTEDMCQEEGKFWKKGKKNEIPEPLRQEESKPPPAQIKPMSAMVKRKANKNGLLAGHTTSTLRRSNTAPPKANFAVSNDEKKTTWQPLTLNALTEYKPSFDTSGQGSFRQGQEVLWKPILSTKT